MRSSPRIHVLAVALLAALAPAARADVSFVYQSFDPPGGVNSPAGDSQAASISNTGVIIGTYYDASNTAHGYELSNGVYTTFDAPGAATGNYNGTYGQGINSSGQALFLSYDSNGHATSYLYSGGVYTEISDPHAVATQTYANTINDAGIVTGAYYPAGGGANHGFQYNTATMQYTTLPDVPGSTGSFAQSTSAVGTLVNYTDSGGNFHGALLSGGTYTTFYNVPFSGATSTYADGINASGMISGNYYNGTRSYGFELINGTYYSIDYPGSTNTQLYYNNDAGQAVGFYVDASGEVHSLLVTPVPEPSSLALAGLGVAGMIGYGRRRRRARG